MTPSIPGARIMPHARVMLAVLCLVAVTLGVSCIVQHHGIGLMGDSSRFFHYGSQPGLSSLPVHDAPLYPALLRLHGPFNTSISAFAAIMDTVLFVVFSAVLFAFLYVLNRTCWIALVSTMAVILSRPILTVYSFAATEALFLPLALANMFFFLLAPDRNTRLLVACAGLAALLAIGARYVGVFLCAAGFLYLAVLDCRAPLRLAKQLAIYCSIAALPLLALLIWNHFREGSATSRVLEIHLPNTDKLLGGLFWTLNFFLPFRVIERFPWVSTLVVCALLTLSFVGLRRCGNDRERRFGLICLLWSIAYGGFLLTSLTLFDDLTPLDERILAPLALFLVPLPIYAACLVLTRAPKGVLRVPLICFLAYMTLFTSYRAFMYMEYACNDGLGFAKRAVRESASLRDAVQISGDIKVYSNAPEAASLLYDCTNLVGIPYKLDPMSLRPNPGYKDQMLRVRGEVSSNRAIVALFFFKHRPDVWTHYLPTIQELRDTLGAVDIRSYNDAVFLGSPESGVRVKSLLTAGHRADVSVK